MGDYTNSGDGKTSPYGNGSGDAKSAGSASIPNLLVSPQGGCTPSGGRDFIAENMQPKTAPCGPNPDSIPAGGKLPMVDPPKPRGTTGMPFRLKG
jgi:hypothetical protein